MSNSSFADNDDNVDHVIVGHCLIILYAFLPQMDSLKTELDSIREEREALSAKISELQATLADDQVSVT